jgi:photosystem II stability/assembly factor-like uncharacterized protein
MKRIATLLICYCLAILPILAQKTKSKPIENQAIMQYDSTQLNYLKWRNIGPFRGGRSAAVCGVNGQPNLFYFGSVGGGVWKTTDAGTTWTNISDGYFGGSIGAVAVSESDNNVIYVGGGEKTVRGNVSQGNGVWRSTDAGKTWTFVGLAGTQHISRLRIDKNNPDIVYAAVMGHLFGSHADRGVYKTTDGGKNWKKVLFANNDAGAVDLIIDPTNSRILFASTWRVRRTPYSFESGGEGSALWKSTDGGETWKNISENKGLPKGTWGIVGVTVSPVNANRIWAIIENAEGGIFRSENGGETWTKVNEERKLRQRAWYYSRIYADTKDEDMLYVLNVDFHRSKDGGKTFENIDTPHGDHHDLWISSQNPDILIIGDDGGAQVSVNKGKTFSTYMNQPTAQFYRVVTDNNFPYKIYVAQQDNSTLRVSHRTFGGGITDKDWEITAGGESGHIAVNPENSDIVYGGSYGGFFERLDHKTGQSRIIDIYPDNPIGAGASAMKYRFQWNFPISFSPHDSKVLYAGANCLFRTTNEGQTWEKISPDLTTNDSLKQISTGGSITKDNTGVEYYCTIFAAAESPTEKGVIYTGSDDGLVHVTMDNGKNWQNITPPKTILPEFAQINSLEIHPTQKGTMYLAAVRYKLDDFQPYLLKTTDYGKTWTKIVNGIDKQHFTRVIRADKEKAGLLFAGTEQGMYVSFDDGANWQPFQLNLPIVPITDLTIKDNDLIAATQGRALWIIDDITPLRTVNNAIKQANFQLFAPRKTYRVGGGNYENPRLNGQNLQSGVMVQFYVKNKVDSTNVISLEFLDKNNKTIRKFSTDAKEKEDKLEAKAGGNRFFWNMRYPNAEKVDGMLLWGGGLQGALAVPDTYKVKMKVGKDSTEATFEIAKDPRLSTTQAEYQAQFDFLNEIAQKLTETHKAIKKIRAMREQLQSYTKRLDKEKHKEILETIKATEKKITDIEEALYQTKLKSSQDMLNFPIKLNNKLSWLVNVAGSGDFRPTDAAIEVKNVLTSLINKQLAAFETVLSTDLPKLNKQIKEKEIEAVVVK